MEISKTVLYVGVNDHITDLFEGQYVVPNGMAYNSYLILDQKIAVMDTVDIRFCDEWLNNLEKALDGKTPDYLIVQHMEPDHSGSIVKFMEKYSDAQIVSSIKAFTMMKNYFGTDFSDRQVVVGENSTLSLGERVLTFITAPMVHWPEVIVTYDSLDKILFSADGFGKFGALDIDEDWACEARRYYFGIVGKYGANVQILLKKASNLDIQTICPLHGPILSENLSYYINLYDIWSSYKPEVKGVFIAYTSVYGNTKKAVEILAEKLKKKGVKVSVSDLAREDLAEAVEDAFKYDKLVLATTTYNGGIFPYMNDFIHHLTERNYQNRTVAFVENGSWMPTATKVMKDKFSASKNLNFANTEIKILSSLSDKNLEEIDSLTNELV